MKKIAIVLFAVAVFMGFAQSARAFQVTLTSKQVTVTVVISPSPTPVAYIPSASGGYVIGERPAAERRIVPSYSESAFASMLAYDPFSLSDMVAQTNPQGSVKVNFTVKPDPNFAYFHITPGANMTLNAGYGTNTYTCVFHVYAHYATAWIIHDYTHGSNTGGGTAGFNSFPTFNYPTTSDIAWLAETVTTSYKAFSNGGTPGETTFSGTAGSTKNICIDLQVTVPNNVNAGTYPATFDYYMTHS